MTTTPATQNEAWGFFGTLGEQAATAWPLALATIADTTGQTLDAAAVFLDSSHGRHFADDVLSGLAQGQPLPAAINATARRWMGWTIGRQVSTRYDIPRGLPYLTAFVIHCEIAAEALAA